jgi:hypothetical protein
MTRGLTSIARRNWTGAAGPHDRNDPIDVTVGALTGHEEQVLNVARRVFPIAVRAFLGVAVVGMAVGSCQRRALVTVDVRGDGPYSHVTLQLAIEGGEVKTFTGASFDAALPYRAGLYLAGDGASARITAAVITDSCVVATGSAPVPPATAGQTVGPVDVLVTKISPVCVLDGGPGGAPGDGAIDLGPGGTGGSTGAGGSGSGGMASGAGGAGTGGRVAGTGGMGTGGAGTGGAPCAGNFGQSCGNCAGTIRCDGTCSHADTSCAPTGTNHQLRNKGLMAASTVNDWVLDIYSGDPFNAFMDTPCCSGSVWTITALGNGAYAIYSQAFADAAGHAMALQSYPDGSSGLQLGTVNGGVPSPAQTWTITALGGGYFRLSNALLGPGSSVESDVDAMDPRMAPTSTNTSQSWLISP